MELSYKEYDRYLNHKDWFLLEFDVPEVFPNYEILISALKHCYKISIIKTPSNFKEMDELEVKISKKED